MQPHGEKPSANDTLNRNVFADLGFENPDEMLIKAELARRISKIIKNRRLTQRQAARLLHVDQPKVSALINGKLRDFSTERLVRFLLALGRDVELRITKAPKSREQGRVKVRAA